MEKFALLHNLQEEKHLSSAGTGIKYQQYDISHPAIGTRTVLIPLRECERFEKQIEEIDENLTKDLFKKLMREFRGITNHKE